MTEYKCRPDHPNGCEHLVANGVSPLLATVLSGRGYTEIDRVNQFINPPKIPLPDPYLLRDMSRGVDCINASVISGKTIAVYGDYDVDGITATALLTHFLQDYVARHNSATKIIPYIPKRLTEGYGLSRFAISQLKDLGVDTIVTVDCGISSVDEAVFARSLGLTIVMTDHHTCQDSLPDVCAVINPMRCGCPYPFKGLAGVGVALMLALGLSPVEDYDKIVDRYCDLVAVGTIADVMPMEGENRTLTRLGLTKLNKNPGMGMRALMRESGYDKKDITAVGVGFSLAPRINAAGRMDHATLAVDLLLTERQDRAESLVAQLCELNSRRQQIELEVFNDCLERLDKNPPEGLIFLSDHNWHQGVVGIVASRLTERFHLPVFMVCCDRGVGNGSGRSNTGANLFALLEQSAHLLTSFGGHPQASGFTLPEERLDALCNALRDNLSTLSVEQKKAPILVDGVTHIRDLTCQTISDLDLLEPSGVGNPRPVLLLEGARVLRSNLVADGKHLRLRVCQDQHEIEGIYFYYQKSPPQVGSTLDLIFYPQNNHHRGMVTPQLQIIGLVRRRDRAQTEELLYKWRAHRELSPDEAKILCPTRLEIEGLYAYLRQGRAEQIPIPKGGQGGRFQVLCDQIGTQLELPFQKVEVGFAVYRELGSLDLLWREEGAQISFPLAPKNLSLEDSPLLMQLHHWAHQGRECY